MAEPPQSTGPPGVVRVERWPTEAPLAALVALAAAGVWLLLALSIFGIFYAVFIGLFFFVSHLSFTAYLRGSAVRLGPDQFPQLHDRVVSLSRRAGLPCAPDAYIMQAGGTLNAMATKLFRSNMIVLFTDLLDACGEDDAARDMIVGHEIGHIRAGHLRFIWFLFPGLFVPFLGGAYLRSRELTCDRYGAALCGDRRGALLGLAVLAAGGSHGRSVNLGAFAAQRADLDSGWMTLARWLGAYPPLCDRVGALAPELVPEAARSSARGPLRALGILATGAAIVVAGFAGVAYKLLPAFQGLMEQARIEAEAAAQRNAERTAPPGRPDEATAARVVPDLRRLAEVAEESRGLIGELPRSAEALYAAWMILRPGQEPPFDPADGGYYGYELKGAGFWLWSSGPDGESGTEDDIVYPPVEDPDEEDGPPSPGPAVSPP